MQDDGNMGKIPRVYINTEEDNEECFLLVYRALGASICLLMKSKQSSHPYIAVASFTFGNSNN